MRKLKFERVDRGWKVKDYPILIIRGEEPKWGQRQEWLVVPDDGSNWFYFIRYSLTEAKDVLNDLFQIFAKPT